jgi:methionyl-tRNA formyltransferase
MIFLMVGNVAGQLAVDLAKPFGIGSIVAYDNKESYQRQGLRVYDSIHDERFYDALLSNDLLCVHGREIVPETILRRSRRAVNVHPYFEKYKGKSPIQRALNDKDYHADVTAHKMTAKVDEGQIVYQEKKIILGRNVQDTYFELYPLYVKVIRSVLDKWRLDDQMTGVSV